MAHFNDQMSWLEFLRDDAGRKTKRKKQDVLAEQLTLEPIDEEQLKRDVEREAAVTAEQIVTVAKAEAAMFVHQSELAVELLDRVWMGLE